MKTYSIRVSIRAENESDLFERIGDLTENPICSCIDKSVKVIENV